MADITALMITFISVISFIVFCAETYANRGSNKYFAKLNLTKRMFFFFILIEVFLFIAVYLNYIYNDPEAVEK